jgi:hypothetical protein
MLVFNKYFYKKKKSKLYFEDRVAVLNDFIYRTGGSIELLLTMNVISSTHFSNWLTTLLCYASAD